MSPRFSWITSTAPFGAAAVASTPTSSPLGPANRISSVPAALCVDPVAGGSVVNGAVAIVDAAEVPVVKDPVVDAAGALAVDPLVDPGVGVVVGPAVAVAALPPVELAQAARMAPAAGTLRPRSVNRRSASRRENAPSVNSRAISCAR